MKNTAMLLVWVLVWSCQQPATPPPPATRPLPEVAPLKSYLQGNMTANDYAQLQWEKASAFYSQYLHGHVVKIPLVHEPQDKKFILVQYAGTTIFKARQVAVHGYPMSISPHVPNLYFDGTISVRQLAGDTIFESDIRKGYIVQARDPSPLQRLFPEQVAAWMPELLIIDHTEPGRSSHWTVWINYHRLLNPAGLYFPTEYVPLSGELPAPYPGTAAPPALTDIDVQELADCFSAISDEDAVCTAEILVDLPTDADPTEIFSIAHLSAGHAFIRLTKKNGQRKAVRYAGFYPQTAKGIFWGATPARLAADTARNFDAALKITIYPAQLQTILRTMQTLQYKQYQLMEWNCTDWALAVINSIRRPAQVITVPEQELAAGTITFRSPAGFYHQLVSMQNSPWKGFKIQLFPPTPLLPDIDPCQ